MRQTVILVVAISLATLGLFSGVAEAADRTHHFPVEHALKSDSASALLDVPIFMKGADTPAVAQRLGEYKSNKKTNGFRKEDQVACDHAFISAVVSLQQRAQNEGGNAVVDVYSITKDVKYEDAEKYSCVAGNIMIHVALMGTVAKIEE